MSHEIEVCDKRKQCGGFGVIRASAEGFTARICEALSDGMGDSMNKKEADKAPKDQRQNPALLFCPLINNKCNGEMCAAWYHGEVKPNPRVSSEPPSYGIYVPGCGAPMLVGD